MKRNPLSGSSHYRTTYNYQMTVEFIVENGGVRPAIIDDKLHILTAVKKVWGERVTTVFAKQGHYAFDSKILADNPPAGIQLAKIGDLLNCDLTAFLKKH